MPRFIRFLILPALGLVLLGVAYFWSQREVNLRFFGKSAEGRLIGMVLQRPGSADVLTSIETQLLLSLGNGDRIDVNYTNYERKSAVYQPADGGAARPISADDLVTGSKTSSLGTEIPRIISESVRADVAMLGWALLRESRRPEDPRRVVRLEKIENVHGYVGISHVPEVFDLRNGTVVIKADQPDAPPTGTIRIRAVLDRSDPVALKARKGDVVAEYSYERNGVASKPEKKNFFLNTEPYASQFRPIFGFKANDREVARLSHIGRHGGPTLALLLFGPCRVYYDPKNPEQAVVTAVAGPVAGEPLAWFTRYCEGLFGQWGSGSLIVLAGLLFICTGLAFIYMAIKGGGIPHSSDDVNEGTV
jgi:hypothetical protein